MTLFSFKKNQDAFEASNQNFRAVKIKFTTIFCVVSAFSISGFKPVVCQAQSPGFAFIHDSRQHEDVFAINQVHGAIAFYSTLIHEHELCCQRVSDSIEFFSFIPFLREQVTQPDSKPKSENRPDERKKGRIGVKQKNELPPEDNHKFRKLLFGLGVSGAIVLFSAACFGLRLAVRRDYAQGKSVRISQMLGLMSVLIIPRKVKNKRWQIWEQRQWFRDLKLSNGFDVAYRDARHWRKLVAEFWG